MRSPKFTILPPPAILQQDVECIRIAEHSGEEGAAIKVAPKAQPGIAFQHCDGQSALENIVTPSEITSTPTLFLYGAGTEPSVMNFKNGSYATIQVIFKPHALKSLFGMDASVLSNGHAELNEFSTDDLNAQLMEAGTEQDQMTYLINFLVTKLKEENERDALIEESLLLIHRHIASISVKFLLEALCISERHFERRFSQTVGVSPRSYIRVRRFNEAIRLIKTGLYEKLTDIAQALGYYDQSHFIRDIKTFSGMTPKDLSLKEGDSYHDQLGYSYV
jgi:AraC-like DNA-binding protein